MGAELYERIIKIASELANSDVEEVKSKVHLIPRHEANLFKEYKDGHLSNLNKIADLFEKNPNIFEEYEETVKKANEFANSDVEELKSKVHLIPRNEARKFIEYKKEHLANLLKSLVDKNKTRKKREVAKSLTGKDKFITLKHEDSFYQRLEKEINLVYSVGAYTATLILSRKLIENLLIDVLRKKYGATPQKNLEIYFNKSNSRFHDFTILLKNLEDRKSDFIVDMDILKNFIPLVKPFRKGANSKTHSIVNFIDKKEELEKYDIQQMANLLIRLHNNI